MVTRLLSFTLSSAPTLKNAEPAIVMQRLTARVYFLSRIAFFRTLVN
jgi:hypothetical protein